MIEAAVATKSNGVEGRRPALARSANQFTGKPGLSRSIPTGSLSVPVGRRSVDQAVGVPQEDGDGGYSFTPGSYVYNDTKAGMSNRGKFKGHRGTSLGSLDGYFGDAPGSGGGAGGDSGIGGDGGG